MLKREFARFVRLARQVLRMSRPRFASSIKVTTHALDQWVGKRGGYKSENFERIWEVLKRSGIDPNDIRRRALEGKPMVSTGLMRQLSVHELAILDAWNELEQDERLLTIIESLLSGSAIRPPSKRSTSIR